MMKKVSTLLMSLVLIVSVWGQGKVQKEINISDLKNKTINQILKSINPQLIIKDYLQHEQQMNLLKGFKSQNDMKQGLDSILYYEDSELTMAERYTYNIQGKCVLYEELVIAEGVMMVYRKSAYTFDTFGNLISYSLIDWNEELNQWKTRLKTDFTFEGGLLDYAFLYFLDFDSYELELLLKEDFVYDNQNRMISTISTFVSEDVWTNSFKEDIAYNAEGYAYIWTSFTWNETSSLWIPAYKDEDIYDDNDDLEISLQSQWDELTNAWLGKYKDEYTYDDAHQILDRIYSEYDEFSSQWGYFSKDAYTYDDQGNFITIIDYSWAGSSWEEHRKDEFTYDYSYTFDQILVPWVGEYDFETKNMLTKQNDYEWLGSWQAKGEAVLFYSERDVNAIEELSSQDIVVYPNPSSGMLRIAISDFGQEFIISIIDIAGKTLERREVIHASSNEYQETFDLSNYSSGVYFVRISNSDKTSNKKIMIQ